MHADAIVFIYRIVCRRHRNVCDLQGAVGSEGSASRAYGRNTLLTVTFQLARANLRARSRPIPSPAPVINTLFELVIWTLKTLFDLTQGANMCPVLLVEKNGRLMSPAAPNG